MGKPRMILLIRHAQSEGNKNRDIHQFIPDHRVKLTQDGWQQAEEAGRRLRSMLRPDDTIQFYTSPYRRTRETTEAILKSLTSDDPSPSPFPRHKVKVYEEPRLREQDFGNFQPCSAEMERMWQERADYGHFFYRIPNGESAADAYDRISGFNESLWRQFGEEDFPSVCVLVTHGLMTRVFLMKWYHWSVEYFEDLRNVNHCEFIVMKQNPSNKKFELENEMRTWSELKKRTAAAASIGSANVKGSTASLNSSIPIRKWGGCANGCNHDQMVWPKKNQVRRQNTMDYVQAATERQIPASEKEDDAITAPSPSAKTVSKGLLNGKSFSKISLGNPILSDISDQVESPPLTSGSVAADADASSSSSETDLMPPNSNGRPQSSSSRAGSRPSGALQLPQRGREYHHVRSGPSSPNEPFSEDSDYYPKAQTQPDKQPSRSIATVFGAPSTTSSEPKRRSSRSSNPSQTRKNSIRKQQKTEAQWTAESGMGQGARAEKLGDGDEQTEGEDLGTAPKGVVEKAVEEAKMEDRKSLSEVY